MYKGESKLSKKVRKLTSEESFRASMKEKDYLVKKSSNPDAVTEIFDVLEKRLMESGASKFKVYINTLNLMKYLIINGKRPECFERAMKLERVLRKLTKFYLTAVDGREMGGGVRRLAEENLKLLEDEDFLMRKRKESKKIGKYQGFSVQTGWRKDEDNTENQKDAFEETKEKEKKKKRKEKRRKSLDSDSDIEKNQNNFVLKLPKSKKKKKKHNSSRRNSNDKNVRTKKEPKPSKKKKNEKKEINLLDFQSMQEKKVEAIKESTLSIFDKFEKKENDGFNPFSTKKEKIINPTNDFFEVVDDGGDVMKTTDLFTSIKDDDEFSRIEKAPKKQRKNDSSDLLNYLEAFEEKKKQNDENPQKKMTINQIRKIKGKKPAKNTILPMNTTLVYPHSSQYVPPSKQFFPQPKVNGNFNQRKAFQQNIFF